MATKAQKVDYILESFTFKRKITKKDLSALPEEKLDNLIRGYEKGLEEFINRPKLVKYMVDGTKDGSPASWDIKDVSEEALKDYLGYLGITVEKVVPAKGNHRCLYCHGIASGTQKNLLCGSCRELFGHDTFDEL